MIDKRNYEATAQYFERRASKVPEGPRRHQLELAMQLYRQLAAPDATRDSLSGKEPANDTRGKTFNRRQRLIELFRRGTAGEGTFELQESRRS